MSRIFNAGGGRANAFPLLLLFIFSFMYETKKMSRYVLSSTTFNYLDLYNYNDFLIILLHPIRNSDKGKTLNELHSFLFNLI